MLRVKSDEEKGKHTAQQIRKRNKKRIRDEELQTIFAAIRQKLIEDVNQSNIFEDSKEQRNPQVVQQPSSHNYYQYLDYAMRMLPAQHHHIINPQTPYTAQPLPSLMNENVENIYFQKNGYIIYRNILGMGAYAKVWLGIIKATGQKIAAKQVQKLEQNQCRCLIQLQSDYIVKILDIFTHFQKSFVILEYCDKDLSQQLKECNYKLEMALKYFEQLVYGIDVLQAKNIIHRDLKLQNILVKDKTIKIADFGFAKCLGDQLQVQSRRCGSPYTMAPQIYFSTSIVTPYTIKCDIWSIGVILHEMLYKTHPFHGNSLNFRINKRARVNRKFGILDKIIDNCLEFNPIDRFNWVQFKTFFNIYLQQKNCYFSSKDKIYSPNIPIKHPKPIQSQRKPNMQDNITKKDDKSNQKPKILLKQRQQSKDRRQDRTPYKRKNFICQKDLKERNKFEQTYTKQKKHQIGQKLHQIKRFEGGYNYKKKVIDNNDNKNEIKQVDFKQAQQRPFPTSNTEISKQKLRKQCEQLPKGRLVFQACLIIMVIFALVYISFK